ncbi:unnamed protein product [Trifolium pratense]|uniref:Uncharacterized protein n=1 Tax=Trifolium pratense TaxID=57577 RepID=A0ACB0L6S8_TRIPR|nr:unnamed protein product [Trifolium pratense]
MIFSKSKVYIGEALGLLSTLKWVHELNIGAVHFELDSKRVVDKFHSSNRDLTEFGAIMDHCKSLFSSFYRNSSVEFVQRQVNKAAHTLAQVATLYASFQVMVDASNCIEHILINEML